MRWLIFIVMSPLLVGIGCSSMKKQDVAYFGTTNEEPPTLYLQTKIITDIILPKPPLPIHLLLKKKALRELTMAGSLFPELLLRKSLHRF